MVQLKQNSDVTTYCGHLKHPGMSRIQFEFSTLAGASDTERSAAAFNALSAALSTVGVELKYIEVAIAE